MEYRARYGQSLAEVNRRIEAYFTFLSGRFYRRENDPRIEGDQGRVDGGPLNDIHTVICILEARRYEDDHDLGPDEICKWIWESIRSDIDVRSQPTTISV